MPGKALRFRVEQRARRNLKLIRQPLEVRLQFGLTRIFLRGHIARLVEKRNVDIGFGVACRARIPVPVPGAANISAAFAQTDIGDALLDKPPGCPDPRHSAADNDRSEAHTSELPSPMSISYHVHCMNKKN